MKLVPRKIPPAKQFRTLTSIFFRNFVRRFSELVVRTLPFSKFALHSWLLFESALAETHRHILWHKVVDWRLLRRNLLLWRVVSIKQNKGRRAAVKVNISKPNIMRIFAATISIVSTQVSITTENKTAENLNKYKQKYDAQLRVIF